MEQRDIKPEIQALWLQYAGLKTGAGRNGDWIENAARTPVTPVTAEELVEIPGLVIAT